MKKGKWILFFLLLLFHIGNVFAEPGRSVFPTHTGVEEINKDQTLEDVEYSSSTGGENVFLISSSTSTFKNITVEKTGDSSGEEADFYGTNAAIFVYEDATLNFKGGSVTTNGNYANGIFSYGSGTINVENVAIKTTSDHSGGIMVTGGGNLTGVNLIVETSGNSSAAIRSDRGGGVMEIEGGSYRTSGVGSPAIYSTADITVRNANLISEASEGIVVEGANHVSLDGVTLTDTNTTLNGKSETYKNIFLYQSMSGDASVGTSSFEARNSIITTNAGDTFYITNTSSDITLEKNEIHNTNGNFLRIEAAAWGDNGTNGGDVVLNLSNQKIRGDILVDQLSTLVMNMEKSSEYIGVINGNHDAKEIHLSLSAGSKIVLMGDSYLDEFDNEDETNQNVYLNGYHLYVDGAEVSGNPGAYEETKEDTEEKSQEEETPSKNNTFIVVSSIVVAILGVVIFIVRNIQEKKERGIR